MITQLKQLRKCSTHFNPKMRAFLGVLRILLGLFIYSFGVYLTIYATSVLHRGTASAWEYRVTRR